MTAVAVAVVIGVVAVVVTTSVPVADLDTLIQH